MISASLGSATLNKNILFPSPCRLREAADDDGTRRVVVEDDHARTVRDRLGLVGCVSEEGLGAAPDRDHHLAHPPRVDLRADAANLSDQLVIGFRHNPTVVRAFGLWSRVQRSSASRSSSV